MPNFMCRKCNSTSVYMQQHGMQVGLYCGSCGAWQKWVGKKDIQQYKNLGVKLYGQNMVVELDQKKNMGLEPIIVSPQNLEKKEKLDNDNSDVPFEPDLKTEQFGRKTMVSDEAIENEVERRVALRLKELEKDSKESLGENVEGGYCPVCEGNPLVAEGNSKVEVTIFSGVLTVTDPEGLNIYGLYKLKRCPCCGKMF